LNFLRAFFLSDMAVLHSSLNHGFRAIRGSLDVFGIVRSAMERSTSVNISMGLLFNIISSQTSSVEIRAAKVTQSAFSSFHL
jgi:hypothetical protein